MFFNQQHLDSPKLFHDHFGRLEVALAGSFLKSGIPSRHHRYNTKMLQSLPKSHIKNKQKENKSEFHVKVKYVKIYECNMCRAGAMLVHMRPGEFGDVWTVLGTFHINIEPRMLRVQLKLPCWPALFSNGAWHGDFNRFGDPSLVPC